MYIPNNERYIEISHLEAYRNYFQSQLNNIDNKMKDIERNNDILKRDIESIKVRFNKISLWEFIKRKLKGENIC